MASTDGLKENPPKKGLEAMMPSRKNILLRLVWPSIPGLAAPAPKFGALPEFCELSMGTVPGANCSNCENCRPFKGRSVTSCCGITVPSDADVVSRAEVEAETAIVSAAVPTFKVAFKVASSATCNVRPDCSEVPKPALEMVT